MRWLVASAFAVFALTGCRKITQPPVIGDPSLADSAEQVLFDVRSNLTDQGVKRGQMFADTVYVYNDQTRLFLINVRANFNTETGAPNGTLRGDRGRMDRRTQILEGFGNVVVTSTDGRRLSSNHLRYSQLRNEVSSDSAFTLVAQDRVQRGIGFTSDPNITRFRCHQACSGSATVPLGDVTP